MKKNRLKYLALVITLAAILGACSSVPTSDSVPLEGTNWELVAYRKSKPIPGSDITLTFDEGRISGSAGCNTYFGDYQVDGDRIKISEPAMTEMACFEPEGIMDQELMYLGFLASAQRYQIEDDKLMIYWTDHEALTYMISQTDLK